MRFANRMSFIQRSYIREILKVTADPEIISFAGGLPMPELFPVREIREAADAELAAAGPDALQYSTTEGYPPLREIIAARYKARFGFDVSPDEILVTTGSQQGLDLIARIFLNEDESVAIERPGYLGAIQCFSFYGAIFRGVDLLPGGIDTAELDRTLQRERIRILYTVPNFQNPSGLTYDLTTRKEVARLLRLRDTILVEDDPYGELRFLGEDLPPIRAFMSRPSVMLGSFSKIVAPGMRIGWIMAPREIIDKAVTAKQAADLHTSTLTQRVVARYLAEHDVEAHIGRIRDAYREHRDAMVEAIREHFPESVRATEPQGGMFLWVTLPPGCRSAELFEAAVAEKVAFVPGEPFYTDGGGGGAMRLNYTNASPERIREGVKRLGRCLERFVSGCRTVRT